MSEGVHPLPSLTHLRVHARLRLCGFAPRSNMGASTDACSCLAVSAEPAQQRVCRGPVSTQECAEDEQAARFRVSTERIAVLRRAQGRARVASEEFLETRAAATRIGLVSFSQQPEVAFAPAACIRPLLLCTARWAAQCACRDLIVRIKVHVRRLANRKRCLRLRT